MKKEVTASYRVIAKDTQSNHGHTIISAQASASVQSEGPHHFEVSTYVDKWVVVRVDRAELRRFCEEVIAMDDQITRDFAAEKNPE